KQELLRAGVHLPVICVNRNSKGQPEIEITTRLTSFAYVPDQFRISGGLMPHRASKFQYLEAQAMLAARRAENLFRNLQDLGLDAGSLTKGLDYECFAESLSNGDGWRLGDSTTGISDEVGSKREKCVLQCMKHGLHDVALILLNDLMK